MEIQINGKSYPIRQTMGAVLRFKRETNKEITDLDNSSISDICAYLWCCVTSACKHDNIKFGLSLMDFADAISTDDMAALAATLTGGQGGVAANGSDTDIEKKSIQK